jgi:hypothetical protein
VSYCLATIWEASAWERNVILAAHVNAGLPLTILAATSKNAINAAVKWQPMKISWVAWKLGLFQLRFLEVFRENQLHPYQNTWSAHTFPYIYMEFSSKYIQMPQTSSCYTLFWRRTKSVCLVGFCSTSTTVTCEHQVKFVLFVNMFIMSSSLSRVWVGIVSDVILSPHMPTDGLTAQEYCFLETLPSELLGCSPHTPVSVSLSFLSLSLSLSVWSKCEFNTNMF